MHVALLGWLLRTMKTQNRDRNRFVLWFFVVGTLIPVLLVTLGFLAEPWLGDWRASGLLGTTLVVLTWLVWPTWIFLLDAERAREIIVMLLFASPVNGLRHSTIGLLIWSVRHRIRKQPDAPNSHVAS